MEMEMKIKFNMIKILVLISIFLLGCDEKSSSSKESSISVLETIKAKKQLDVVMLNSQTVYYIGPQKELGFEYELMSAYAKDLGVDLNITTVNTIDEALQKTRDGVGDITSSAITRTSLREKEFKYGPNYYSVQEQLICHQSLYRKGLFPKDKEDLVGLNIVVGVGTSYESTMKEVQREIPEIKFTISSEYSTDILLEMTHKKEIDCTVVDSNIFLLNQRYYPSLAKALVLSDRKNLAWLLRDTDDSLNKSLDEWLSKYIKSGAMAELIDNHYSYLGVFDYYDTEVFHKRLKKRLPKYVKYFKAAGKKYDIPWQLLAAQSYQESHWNPKAKSYTGVRGMMMITKATAKQLGVKNILDPKESIFGGAKYLRNIEKRLPKEIIKSNRLKFTFAAYNVGMGHIYDARKLAVKLNKNPNSWIGIKSVLPLLSQKKYYKNLKYGYARGEEPVKYVDSIHRYYNIILNEYKD